MQETIGGCGCPALAGRPISVDPALDDLGGCPGWIGCFISINQALFQLRPGITTQIELKPSILLGQGKAEKLGLLSLVQLLDFALFEGKLIFLQKLTKILWSRLLPKPAPGP